MAMNYGKGNRQLSDEDVRRIRKGKGMYSSEELGRRFKCSKTSIQKIWNRTQYGFVPDDPCETLSIAQLVYILSQHPADDLVDLSTLTIEIMNAQDAQRGSVHVRKDGDDNDARRSTAGLANVKRLLGV